MLFWGVVIIVLSVAMIAVSACCAEAYYHVSIAGSILTISLLMMYKYIIKKPTDRQKILEKQIEYLARENRELRKRL